MAQQTDFSWSGIFIRLFFALLLVFASYNPEGYSFYHWGVLNIENNTAIKVFAGVFDAIHKSGG